MSNFGVDHYVESDGTTVWVHRDGMTIARFGTRGIDVHTADTTGCLDCVGVEGETTYEHWQRFVDSVKLHHNVDVDNEHMPHRIRCAVQDEYLRHGVGESCGRHLTSRPCYACSLGM